MCLFFLFVCILSNTNQAIESHVEVQTIEKEIYQLQETQEQIQSTIRRKANDAMRWQFQSQNYLEARRAWDEIALGKEKIREIEKRIEQLETRKKELLQ